MRRWLVGLGIAVVSITATLGPLIVDGGPRDPGVVLASIFMCIAGLALIPNGSAPIVTLVIGGVAILAASLTGEFGRFADSALIPIPALAAVAGGRLRGWPSYAAGAAYVIGGNVGAAISHDTGPVWTMLIVLGFAAGRVVRERSDVATALAERSRELDEERELFADLSVRYERARIAAELHDIVGHAISVMVVQAAAGQRLVDRDPAKAAATFSVIADAARQGSEDLNRLVALLGGDEGRIETSDLDLIDEVVQRAARTGLDVTCRFEGERGGVPPETARIAFRVVQEGLTNALRHAPGSAVAITVRSDHAHGRGVAVRVENGPPRGDFDPALAGTGTGLRGVRERVQAVGGSCEAEPTTGGGWRLEAVFPPG
ncbi:MAG TPA: histidine kinase [Actinomycetota bacterium]|jgi:signal transduction histidine kinase|nr:histidine kinase [Actinomycetota bacterium]